MDFFLLTDGRKVVGSVNLEGVRCFAFVALVENNCQNLSLYLVLRDAIWLMSLLVNLNTFTED